jgi:fluoride exporter
MFQILLIAVAGAAGTLARHGVQLLLAPASFRFPYGTLLVNLSGCLLVGLFHAQLTERWVIRPEYRVAILVGLLGGYTTFSTFGLETASLLREGHYLRAGMNMVLSNGLGVVCVIVGYAMGRGKWI